MNTKISYIPLYVVSALLGIAVFLVFVFEKPYTFSGTVIEPPLPVEDFLLQTANNESFRLSGQNGKITLLFFGYTSCPDVCPTTLAEFKQVYQKLGDDAQSVQFVMITADPERDKADRVTEYVSFFNPAFIGLSGERSDLEKVWKQFSVFVEKQETNSAAGYLVSHTASVFVLDQNSNLRMTFPYGTSANDMTNDIIQLLKENKSSG
ncbi:MAG: SCO family protein [Anaerolineales bacterium]